MENKFTIVLPTRGFSDIPNNNYSYLHLHLRNMNKFLDLNSIYEIIIITPDKKEAEDKLNLDLDISIKIRFICDDHFILNSTYGGWYKQQFLKLLAASEVETELYMVMDDDLFLNRRLGYSDIFTSDKKIRYSSEKYTELGTPTHADIKWWIGSIGLLKDCGVEVNENMICRDDLISVTPQIFIRDVVLELLLKLYDFDNWMDKFATYGATEFSLYWLYLMSLGKTELYSDREIQWWYTDSNTSLLELVTIEQYCRIIYNGLFQNRGYFMVIQSYFQAPQLRELLESYNAV